MTVLRNERADLLWLREQGVTEATFDGNNLCHVRFGPPQEQAAPQTDEEVEGALEELARMANEQLGVSETDEWGHSAVRPNEAAFDDGIAAVREAARARREALERAEESDDG